jgi:hypothetical protein
VVAAQGGAADRAKSEGTEDVKAITHPVRALAVGIAAAVAFAAFAAFAVEAGATRPPRNCGMMTVKSKRYQIKADQIRCTRAKTYSRRYLSRHARPASYSCRDFGSGTKLKFRCSSGKRVFFAIRR